MCSSRCANISTPTLRKVREGWGTPCVIYASEIKSLGHPPSFDQLRADFWHTFRSRGSRYQNTIATSENTKIIVEIALISGVMPRRRRPQISSGSVLSRPIKKKLTLISLDGGRWR